ncbi:MAG TPA: hypothetical protein VK716_18075 [Terracidiphilus sp.]|nr:hypothetical protein [Terracidiphilus sp.]
MRTFGRLLPLVLLWAVLAGGETAATVQKAKFADRVTVAVIKGRAFAEGYPKIVLFRNVRTGLDLSARFNAVEGSEDILGLAAKHVPFGSYECQVSVDPHEPKISRRIQVDDRHGTTAYFESRFSNAHVLILDALGKKVEGAAVSHAIDEFGEDVASAFKKEVIARVPFGIYTVKVRQQEIDPEEEVKVCFCQEESWAVFGEEVPSLGDTLYPGPSMVVKGKVEVPGGANEPMVLRLTPAYMESSAYTLIPPEAGGKFELSTALPLTVDYIVSLTLGSKLLGAATVRLTFGQTVTASLPSGAKIDLTASP